jgi:hypothetical protein
MYLTYKSINSRTAIALDLKEWFKEAQINKLMLSLEVLRVIPLHHRVFQLTNPIGVTEDLEDPVPDRSLLAVIAIG